MDLALEAPKPRLGSSLIVSSVLEEVAPIDPGEWLQMNRKLENNADTAQLSAGPTPSTLQPPQVRCHRIGAWGDVCTYESLCWDGTDWLMFDAKGHSDLLTAPVQQAINDLVRALPVCVIQ